MIKKLSIFVFFVAIMSSLAIAQVDPPTLSQGEYWTGMWSLSYDYQTNGSVRYLAQDPTNPLNLCAIFMGTHDSTSGAGTNRYVWYSYSADGGLTWNSDATSTTFFQGFPCLAVSSTGIPYIGMHQTNPTSRAYLKADVVFGAGSWSDVGEVPILPSFLVWPHIAVTTNGNVVLAAAPNENPTYFGHYNTWNGSAWLPANVPINSVGGPSGNFSVEAGSGGNAYIFGCEYNVNVASHLYTSNDNGLTFTLQTGANAPPDYIVSGADSLFNDIAGGKDGLYIGNDIHLVYAVYGGSAALPAPPNTTSFLNTKIVHWSAATGIDTVAGRFNMPNLTDTITQVNMIPLCHPSLSIKDGVLYCTFTAFLRGNTQVVDDGSIVNAGEIFLTWSTNNGDTWAAPVNMTNTPSIEEKHPSVVSREFNLAPNDTLGMLYVRDLKAGSWVNVAGWGPAPVYSIYKKFVQGPIGIQQDLQVAREYKLFQNYPNPFNPSTTISYYLQKSGTVSIKVYNVLGSLVATVVNGYQNKGAKEVVFNGSNLASGVYYYTLETEGYRDTKKMILIK